MIGFPSLTDASASYPGRPASPLPPRGL